MEVKTSKLKSEITNHLKYMNHLEVLLNMDTDEFMEEYSLLTNEEQIEFMKKCSDDLKEVNNQFAEIKQGIEDINNKEWRKI